MITPMYGSLVIIEGSLLSIFLVLQWLVALSLWKVVYCRDVCYSIGWQTCHYGRQCVVVIFITLRYDSLVIMEGSMLAIYLLLQWTVAFSLWKVVFCRDFCYSKGSQPCRYGRQSVVEIFVTQMDGRLDIMESSLYLRFCYSNGWQPCHYGRQSIVEIFVTQMDGRLIIIEGSVLS